MLDDIICNILMPSGRHAIFNSQGNESSWNVCKNECVPITKSLK